MFDVWFGIVLQNCANMCTVLEKLDEWCFSQYVQGKYLYTAIVNHR